MPSCLHVIIYYFPYVLKVVASSACKRRQSVNCVLKRSAMVWSRTVMP